MNYLLNSHNQRISPINETLDKILLDINNTKKLDKMRVLEVGIGNGNNSILLSKKFAAYYGIEPDKQVYEVLLKVSKDTKIKTYNYNLEQFANKTLKKFHLIYLRNVIHFLDYDNFITICNKILKKNSYIIIQNPHAKPQRWGDNILNVDSDKFDETIWLRTKNRLDKCYKTLLLDTRLIKYEKDDRYHFFVLKMLLE